MCQYRGRTNYFRVKEEAAFEAAAEKLPDVQIIRNQDGLFGLIDGNPEGMGWITSYTDDETDQDVEVDIASFLADHLADNEIGVLVESGFDKYRSIPGYAIAINNKGETVSLNLHHIYELAKGLGENMTDASY